MDKNITNLGHLRSAMLETKRQASNTLGAVADAIEEMAGVIVTEEQMSAIVKGAVQEVLGGSSSSGGAKPGEPLNPVEVYKNTRPADWLPMPEPADDEMYLLFHIPDGMSSLLAFTVTCRGSYSVELGTAANGAFVPSVSSSIASGDIYEAELFADDYASLTASGMKQVLVKISGTDILTWAPSTHTKKNSPANFAGWNIVEIVCRLPMSTGVKAGNSSGNLALKKLAYYTQYGSNSISNMNSMFNYCYSLTAIPQLDTAGTTSMTSMFSYCFSLTAIPQFDTANVTSMGNMFYSCTSLTAIPQFNTANVTNMGSMFYSCNSLTAIPQFNTANVTNMGSMFYSCNSLTAVPQLDTANVGSMNGMFYSCTSLSAIPQLDTANATNMNSMFNHCYTLNKITLTPTSSGWAGYAISLKDCALSHTALVALFNSLPAITAAKAITLTGNPGVSELTDEEKAIAAGKNWTLIL